MSKVGKAAENESNEWLLGAGTGAGGWRLAGTGFLFSDGDALKLSEDDATCG